MERELTLEQLKELDRIRRLHAGHTGRNKAVSRRIYTAIKEYNGAYCGNFREDMLKVLTDFHGDQDIASRTLLWIFSEAMELE